MYDNDTTGDNKELAPEAAIEKKTVSNKDALLSVRELLMLCFA
jgi:hypothetical protein